MKKYLLMVAGVLVLALGIVGIFVPVLPTTPFLLLATYLFAKSSLRLHAWIQTTKIYRSYVVPFKEAGGLDLASKIRILVISYVVMGISAYFVQRWYVWMVLGGAAGFLLYLLILRIPTISKQELQMRRLEQQTNTEGIDL